MKVIQLLVGDMQVFAYLVACEKTGEAVVIDPAGNENQIHDHAVKNGMRIVKIINTHGHPDHTCGNAAMKKLTGAPIVIHQADAPHMASRQAIEFARMLGCAGSPPADETVADGDVIRAGQEVALQVLHTPGHSPGSICLYTPGHVFTGDTLFVGAVGRTDLPGGSWKVMSQAIHSRIMTLPDETIVWPGHHYGMSPSSTVKEERQGNPFIN
ncbi:beta-lactamase domain-containing protein [Desulfarculus baarsii DSM 2075]|uniref:Beta-lactamase domain-containing protein n=1 Tax=Desulfarculus baarsii (strain ATCC 33931 / DSM 2075 / LMG 7858 / VKM B-1802 / 2st14) TaxID=644282 RepID=E1QLM4_DESB2|nr:MBL fold metallo-hydrolase [Desulfarculus baarsii]ADK86459.1 beta-lactamase domain-containing protein [Desulfarculus baarsii DSM 2075]